MGNVFLSQSLSWRWEKLENANSRMKPKLTAVNWFCNFDTTRCGEGTDIVRLTENAHQSKDEFNGTPLLSKLS